MTEVNGRLDRLGKNPQTALPGSVLFIEPDVRERLVSASGVSLTRSFDYETSDPRTQSRTFVKSRPGKRRKMSNKSYSVGSDKNALAFAQELDELRAEVLGKDHIFRSPAAEELIRRVLALYTGCSTRIHLKYQSRVRQELDSFALIVSGENAKRNLQISRRKELYRQVPPEVGPIFGGHIVSGGLPTMGRRRG